MSTEHIVKAYDEELRTLHNFIVRMGGMVESQIAASIQALVGRDSDLAQALIKDDDKIDNLNFEVDSFATRMLALRQPVAEDLRNVVGALKISSDLERMADYATNVGKRAIALAAMPPVKPLYTIPRMSSLVQEMLRDVLDAYVRADVQAAIKVWHRDAEVDDMYNGLFRELLTYMMEDPRNITACTHLLFVAKNIERIGDHVTNISETIHFLVRGERLRDARPRGDSSPFAIAPNQDAIRTDTD